MSSPNGWSTPEINQIFWYACDSTGFLPCAYNNFDDQIQRIQTKPCDVWLNNFGNITKSFRIYLTDETIRNYPSNNFGIGIVKKNKNNYYLTGEYLLENKNWIIPKLGFSIKSNLNDKTNVSIKSQKIFSPIIIYNSFNANFVKKQKPFFYNTLGILFSINELISLGYEVTIIKPNKFILNDKSYISFYISKNMNLILSYQKNNIYSEVGVNVSYKF